MTYFAYILECADLSHYVGSTENLYQRLDDHNAGKGAIWTSRRRPVRLIYAEEFATSAEASKRERQWKKWTRAKRIALAARDHDQLHQLSKRRNP